MTHQFYGVPHLSIIFLNMKFLSKVDQRREGEDCDCHQNEEKPERLIGLLEGVEQGLKTGEVTDQLVNSQNSHHLDQPNDFPCFSDNFKILYLQIDYMKGDKFS